MRFPYSSWWFAHVLFRSDAPIAKHFASCWHAPGHRASMSFGLAILCNTFGVQIGQTATHLRFKTSNSCGGFRSVDHVDQLDHRDFPGPTARETSMRRCPEPVPGSCRADRTHSSAHPRARRSRQAITMKKDAMQRFEEKIDRNGPIIRLELGLGIAIPDSASGAPEGYARSMACFISREDGWARTIGFLSGYTARCQTGSVRYTAAIRRAHFVPIFHKKPPTCSNEHKQQNLHFQRVTLMAKDLLD